MRSPVVVYAMGPDRPGIVAAVTGVLKDHGCNLEDTSMTILRGHFAMMLVVATPEPFDAVRLIDELATTVSPFRLAVQVSALEDAGTAPAEGDRWTFSVYGADRPGIVHGVASALAERGINIVDLTTRVVGTDDEPVYAMVLEVTIPAGTVMRDIGIRMAELSAELGVEISMNPNEADIL